MDKVKNHLISGVVRKKILIRIFLITFYTLLMSFGICLIISYFTRSISAISILKSLLIPLFISPVIGYYHIRDNLLLLKSESRLKAYLSVSELNIKETHHRIKNNLTMMASLMKLQKLRNPDAISEDYHNQLLARISSMALLQEELYKGSEVNLINIREFSERIIGEIVRNMKRGDVLLEVEVSGDDIFFDADSATPLGLIINELVTNTLKYGLKASEKNCITFSCVNRGYDYIIRYSDNGPGMPDEITGSDCDSLGLTLIKTLTSQIEGSLVSENKNGLIYTFTIPRKRLQEKEDSRDKLYRTVLFNRNITGLTTRILEEGIHKNTYNLILEYAIETIKGVDKASITKLKDDGRYHFVAAKGFNLKKLQQISFTKEENLLKPGEKRARVVSNIEIIQRDEGNFNEDKIEFMNKHGETDKISSSIIVPITYNHVIGAMLNLNCIISNHNFDEDDLDMATVFASQIGLVLEHFEKE